MKTPALARLHVATLSAAGAFVLQFPAWAQWTSDPSTNVPIADASSDQSQSKLASTADGGTWVTWFDGIASGWDVRVQRLDALGVEAFVHGGILVADRGYSSTQDYGLDVSAADDALIVFRDDRPGSTQITAAKVAASGLQPWGPNGVVLTSTSSFVASPRVAGTSDGGAVVAWTEDISTVVQKLDANGNALWGSGVTMTPTSGSYSLADLNAVGDEAIVSLVHQTGGFSSPRHLLAQKFDATGAAQWGAAPISVFDIGSLQFGAFPEFVTTGAGGAVFTWYSSSPVLECFAQRVDASGAELWGQNGLALATTAGNVRVTPSAVYDPVSDDVFAVWVELDGAQSMRGVRAQRLDSTGARLWSDAGTVLMPLGPGNAGLARILADPSTDGALAVWGEAPIVTNFRLFGAHIDGSGAIDVPRFDVASTPGGKSRLQAATSAGGVALLSWKDERSDGGDIFGQNVRFDGTLGNRPAIGTNYCTTNPNSTGQSSSIGAVGTLSASENDVTLVATNLPSDVFGLFVTSRDAGLVMNPGGSEGNLCLGGTIGRYVGPGQILNSASAGRMTLALDLVRTPQFAGFVPAMSGETWRFQAWHRDTVQGAATSNLTDGLELVFL